MAYPGAERIEFPILQELVATGGAEDLRFLYDRLVSYFPQLDRTEVRAMQNGHLRQWRRLVQRAGAALAARREIERDRGRWTITARGRERVKQESLDYSFIAEQTAAAKVAAELSHLDVQQMVAEIGRALGYHAEIEFDYYDVVWRAGKDSPRLSHVFEVQRKGNIDAAFAKLKRAYDAQRSKPYLLVASERDTLRAERGLSAARAGAFHEIGRVTTILSFEQLRRLHRALISVEDVLANFFER